MGAAAAVVESIPRCLFYCELCRDIEYLITGLSSNESLLYTLGALEIDCPLRCSVQHAGLSQQGSRRFNPDSQLTLGLLL